MIEQIPFYDAEMSYDENYVNGPFGAFADPNAPVELSHHTYDFLGHVVSLPFGIPAGPLLNGRFCEAAMRLGFSLATYKTVRGEAIPCHPFPNVIRVQSETSRILPGETVIANPDIRNIDIEHDGITNSFGVPSKDPSVWVSDATGAVQNTPEGSLLIMSFMGTKHEGMALDEYIADFVRTCRLARSTGAPVLEVNFSCPNVGKEGLICNDVETSTAILEALHAEKGNVPLLVKIGYFPKESQAALEQLLAAIHKYAEGVVAINTVQATVINPDGTQALPGSSVRRQSGTCGATIRWAGLEMVDRIHAVRTAHDWKDFTLVGVGGVTKPEDYYSYRQAGADAVQSAAGAMWRPMLAQEIIHRENNH